MSVIILCLYFYKNCGLLSFVYFSTQELDFTLSAAVLLFSRLTKYLLSDSAVYTDALKAALILIFYCLRSFSSGEAKNHEMIAATIKDTLSRLYMHLKEYVGTSTFGGYGIHKAEMELKV